MKKIISAIFAILLVMALAGCGKPSGENQTTLPASAAELWAKANEVSGFGNMTPVPVGDLSDIYGIDQQQVEDFIWYMSENPSLNADETAIFKLTNESYANEVKAKFEARIARQLTVAQGYSPTEASKLENAKVAVEGCWVYYCVGDNSDAMMKVIKNTNK
ncbi:MAG: DUF4358 domain-containing protein [Clostridia bacterium]|nr:DUF4358 domain-containing protein [Clostridia bacterium]